MTRLRATEIAVLNQVSRAVVVACTATASMCVLRFASLCEIRRYEVVGRAVCGRLAGFKILVDLLILALDGFVVACASSAVWCHCAFVFSDLWLVIPVFVIQDLGICVRN
jgi:hypothetical protein